MVTVRLSTGDTAAVTGAGPVLARSGAQSTGDTLYLALETPAVGAAVAVSLRYMAGMSVPTVQR